MGTAAWLVWREDGWKAQTHTLGLFLVQWLLNALWTLLFFGMHQTRISFAEIVLMWIAITLTLKGFWGASPGQNGGQGIKLTELAGSLLVEIQPQCPPRREE